MKYYTFKRDQNIKFDDILNDVSIKKHITEKYIFGSYMKIGFPDDTPDSVLSFLIIKYGNEIVCEFDKDYSPKMYKDYIPLIDKPLTIDIKPQ